MLLPACAEVKVLQGKYRHSSKSRQKVTRLECSRKLQVSNNGKLEELTCHIRTWRKPSRFLSRSPLLTSLPISASIQDLLNVLEYQQLLPSCSGILPSTHILRAIQLCDHHCTFSTYRCALLQQGSIVELDSPLLHIVNKDLFPHQQYSQLYQHEALANGLQRNLPRLVQGVCSGRTKERRTLWTMA
jgi:hypothetical protein